MVNCSCLACQRISGAAYVSVLNVPIAAVAINGAMFGSIRIGDSGQQVETRFCASCGSRMFSMSHSLPHSVGIMATTLDDHSWFRPQFNIYAAQAPHWHQVDRSVPSFDTIPPSGR